MKRKLKPLHEVLAMCKSYTITEKNVYLALDSRGSFTYPIEVISLFDKEWDTINNFNETLGLSDKFLNIPEIFFEPLPVEEKLYRVTFKRKTSDHPYTSNRLYPSEEVFLKDLNNKKEYFDWIHLEEWKRE